MKIFISHASANKEYGNALVELLRGIGIGEEEIIFTSNTVYGIPIGQNIFDWLKSQITERPFVIYLISKEYYSSIPCLNEMGAAWVIENEHAIMFTPHFNINCKEFQSGVLDPREMGFYIHDEERVLSFIQGLNKYFNITSNSVLINQKLRKYISELKSISVKSTQENLNNPIPIEAKEKVNDTFSTSTPKTILKENNIHSKFISDITGNKLKDDELILLHYIIEASKVKLLIGWQEDQETRNIKEWEIANELNNTLSNNYGGAIRRFEMRGYTIVSATTSGGNPKEVKLKPEISSNILDFPQEILDTITNAINRNKKIETKSVPIDDLPF